MTMIRVRHVISALEEMEQMAETLDKEADDGVGNNYANHLGWTINLLKEEMDENDGLIEINVAG